MSTNINVQKGRLHDRVVKSSILDNVAWGSPKSPEILNDWILI